jgi:hypothetical protein
LDGIQRRRKVQTLTSKNSLAFYEQSKEARFFTMQTYQIPKGLPMKSKTPPHRTKKIMSPNPLHTLKPKLNTNSTKYNDYKLLPSKT